MPHVDGIEGSRRVLEAHPEVKVVVLTTFDEDDYVEAALRHGVSGFLLGALGGFSGFHLGGGFGFGAVSFALGAFGGALVVALPMKIEGGSGGPLRAIALISR